MNKHLRMSITPKTRTAKNVITVRNQENIHKLTMKTKFKREHEENKIKLEWLRTFVIKLNGILKAK